MIRFKNVLIICAHPDDEVLGMGGTIPLLKSQGCEVNLVIVTDGVSAQYPQNEEMKKRRRQSLKESSKILGIDKFFHLNFPDMRLDGINQIEINTEISAIVKKLKIDTIFTHHQYDVNLDHQILYKSALVVSRPHQLSTIKNLLTFHVNSSSEWGGKTPNHMFCPNMFFDISKTIQKKMKAFDCYKDEIKEFPHPRSKKAILARAEVNGSESGYNYAECFMLIFSKSEMI